MRIKVKFHLPSKLTGINEGEVSMELKKEISLKEFLDLLGEKYPAFAKNFLTSLDTKKRIVPFLVLINSKSSSLKQTIRQGDDIQIFPMVAGG